VTRLAIIIAVIAALLIAIVIALRIPGSEAWLEDLPGIGVGFEALADVIGTHDEPATELEYRFEHAPSPDALAAVRRSISPATAAVRGDRLVITAATFEQVVSATSTLDRAARRTKLRVFVVVYQSDELDRIKQTLRKDDQANKLALSVELDPLGYHLHAPNGMMMVNPAWAERHHCEGSHYEGTGTSCEVTARDRMDAYVHGDPDLFVDAHPDAFAVPPGRAFYITDAGDGYELEATPIEIAVAQITAVAAAGSTLELTVAPEVAVALMARANAPTVELVAEIEPGVLHTITVARNGLALTIANAAAFAGDLAIAGIGLHQLR
jgi:hypothetical protein